MEDKIYTGLQKVLNQIKRAGLNGDRQDPAEALSLAIDVQRKTILNWLREDGTPYGEPVKLPDNKVSDAVKKAGGVPALAKELGVTTSAIREWVKFGYVPVQRAQQIELLYGIPRAELVSPKMRSAMGIGGEL